MLSKQQRFAALFMVAIFELEFVPQADLYKTANYLRTLGITATVPEDSKDKIIIEEKSYTKAMEKLSSVVPGLPDIYKFVWRNGESETVLYEAQRTEQFVQDADLTDSLKALSEFDEKARITVILKDDKNTVIKYQNVVRKIENMGFKVTFADGYMDAGWTQLPAIAIDIPNNIASLKEAILKLTDLPEVNRLLYNRGTSPHSNEYTVSFEDGVDFELQISRFLANGIEVYKIDKLLNKLFIHFPQSEAQNKNKLEQIKDFEGLVTIKNLHEKQQQFIKPEYAKNVQSVWLDVPIDILEGSWKLEDYTQALYNLAKEEVQRLKDKGMVVLNYGVYTETGEVQLPEVVFSYKDADSPKAEEILRKYRDERSDILLESAANTKKPTRSKKSALKNNSCVQLFQ